MVHSKIEKNEKPDLLAYPKLMISKSGAMVVLFTEIGQGTVVGTYQGYKKPLGYHSESFYMGDFVDFHGTVTIQNTWGK